MCCETDRRWMDGMNCVVLSHWHCSAAWLFMRVKDFNKKYVGMGLVLNGHVYKSSLHIE